MSLSLAACGGGGTSAGSTPPPSGSSTGSGAVQSVADYDIQPELDSSVDYTQGDSYSFIIATDGAEDRVDGLLVHYMADQLNAITGGPLRRQASCCTIQRMPASRLEWMCRTMNRRWRPQQSWASGTS